MMQHILIVKIQLRDLTISDNIFKHSFYENTLNPKYDEYEYERGLASIVYNIFDKNTG